jgi:hypothetical protein
MPRASVSINSSRPDQGDLCRHAAHASVVPDLARTLGLDAGRQAIIRRDADTFARTQCRSTAPPRTGGPTS